MPPDDWATRHPELVHWLQHDEDELVGYAPLDDIPLPTAVFPERLLPFFVVLRPPMGSRERRATSGSRLLPPVTKRAKTTGLKMYQGQFWANFRRGRF